MNTDFDMGWPIHEEEEGHWYFDDTHQLVEWKQERACKKCNQVRLPTGEDPCLGHIPGVEYACCGHGIDELAYELLGQMYQVRQHGRVCADHVFIHVTLSNEDT